jgi:hypothetical protein
LGNPKHWQEQKNTCAKAHNKPIKFTPCAKPDLKWPVNPYNHLIYRFLIINHAALAQKNPAFNYYTTAAISGNIHTANR